MSYFGLKTSFALFLGAAALAACSGERGAAGERGPAGAPGTTSASDDVTPTATLNQVTPRVGLVDRKLQVTLTIDQSSGLALDPSSKVDFGEGVKVTGVKASGPGLVVDLEIAPDAKLGAHDVTITAPGQNSIVGVHAFVVAVPLDLKVSGGKAEQGGLVRVDVSNRDRIWFDTERFTLFPLAAPGQATLLPLAHTGFTPTNGTVVLLGEPLAQAGPLGFLGVNDPEDPGSASFLTEPDAVNVSGRTPTTLTPGSIDKTLAGELETGFYQASIVPQNNEGMLAFVHAKVPDGSTMKPMILAYGEGGKVQDLLDQKQDDEGFPMFGIPATQALVTLPVAATTKSYFVVLDANLGHGPTTTYTLDYATVRAQIVNEKPAPHESGANPQNVGSLPGTSVTVPGRIVRGELKAQGESDVYLFSGLSANNPTDMEVSIVSDADVVVRVDHTPTFDSDDLVEITRGGKAGSGRTNGFVGTQRFIQVVAAPDGAKATGKYTIGIRRVPTN